jgi:protein-L-isoaspartate(D-aspartate) O-methyltransferase
MFDFQAARRAMVDGQIRTSDVTDTRVLAAMLDIPRELFVPDRLAALAYIDRDLPLDGGGDFPMPARTGRFLIKPMVQARLIQALGPGEGDRVLVVGCGGGYAAAVLGRLAGTVTALDENGALLGRCRAVLAKLKIANVTAVAGPLALGWPASSPFDVILVDGGVEFIPEPLFDQLAPSGRLATVMGGGPVGRATLFQSDDNREVSGRALFDATAPLLPGFGKAPAFVF